mgnify:CR=1 FL=1
MKLNIRGEKITVTQSMKNYITEKLAKVDKYFENPEEITANVLVRIKGLEQIIEVTALTKKFTLRAEDSNEDFYAAVDLVVAKLEKQMRKNKDRLNNKYKNVEKLEFNFNYELVGVVTYGFTSNGTYSYGAGSSVSKVREFLSNNHFEVGDYNE